MTMAKVRMQTPPGGKMRDIVKPNPRWARQRPITRGYKGYQGDHGPDVPATGATAGTPGSFTPPGSEVPANFTLMNPIVATPATRWTVGQYVILEDFSNAWWNGTTWQSGRAT